MRNGSVLSTDHLGIIRLMIIPYYTEYGMPRLFNQRHQNCIGIDEIHMVAKTSCSSLSQRDQGSQSSY